MAIISDKHDGAINRRVVVKKFCVAGATFTGLIAAGSAMAADMRARVYAPPPIVNDWTGPYVGVELGAKFGDTNWTATSLRDPPGILPAFGAAQSPIDQTSPRSYNPSSFRAGGYLGYNWQISPLWVVGLEGDIAWADKTQTAVNLPGCGNNALAGGGVTGCSTPLFPGSTPITPGVDSASAEMRWDASLRARLGFLVTPNVLLYGTGGVAWQNMRNTGACGPFAVSAFCNTSIFVGGVFVGGPQAIQNSTTRTGWTIGGGVEGKIYRNWLLRAEYRYADFGTWNDAFAFAPDPLSNNTYRYQLTVHTHIATLGLAYKFDWLRPAVVTK